VPVAIKVDEDLPAVVAEQLRQAGHEEQTVGDERLTGASDADLWDVVQQGHRLLLTADKGFANALA